MESMLNLEQLERPVGKCHCGYAAGTSGPYKRGTTMPFRTLLGTLIFALTLGLAGAAMAAPTPDDAGAGFAFSRVGGSPVASTAVPGSFKVAQRRCRSIDAILDRLMRRGYYNIHKVKVKAATMKVRAYYRGVRYRIKLDNCSGRLIWREPMQ